MIQQLLLAIASHFLLLILVVSAGRFIIDKSLTLGEEQVGLRLGASFFIGIAFFVVTSRLGSFVFESARISALMVLFFGLVLSILAFKKIKYNFSCLLNGDRALWATFILAILFLLFLVYWLPPSALGDNPLSSIGSLHSVRYAWISNSIIESNSILILPQNTAQAILAFISALVSFQAPYLHLYLWLFSSLVFLSFFIHGLIVKTCGTSRASALACLIFLGGNSALSMTHVLTIDSGSPFILSGYTDTLIGVFSIFFFLIINETIKDSKVRFGTFALTLLLIIVNLFSAPQNIVFLFLIPFVLAACGLVRREYPFSQIIFWISVLLLGSIIAVPLGTMFTPSSFLSVVSYDGVMSPSGSGAGLKPYPGIPFHYGLGGRWNFGLKPLLHFAFDFHQSKLFTKFISEAFWGFEQILFTSIRVLFFVIVGLSYICFISIKSQYLNTVRNSSSLVTSFALHGLVFFACGFLLNFFFSLNGYKWELSRFLIPGISIGMFGVALLFVRISHIGFSFKKGLIGIFLLFVLVGPITNFIITTTFNGYMLIEGGAYKSYLTEFFGAGPTVFE